MMKSFLDGYEQGYSAGLRLATTLPGERNDKHDPEVRLEDRDNIASRPAYQHGFFDGLRDGVAVLASVSNAGRGWRRAPGTMRVEVLASMSNAGQDWRRSPDTVRGSEWHAPSLPCANEGYKAGVSAEDSPEDDDAPPADTLRDELRAYHRLLRYGSTHKELRTTIEQLRALIQHLERKWCGYQ